MVRQEYFTINYNKRQLREMKKRENMIIHSILLEPNITYFSLTFKEKMFLLRYIDHILAYEKIDGFIQDEYQNAVLEQVLIKLRNDVLYGYSYEKNSILKLHCTTRIENVLLKNKITRISDLCDMSSTLINFQKFRNFGKISYENLRQSMHENGYYFKDENYLEEKVPPLERKIKALEQEKIELLSRLAILEQEIQKTRDAISMESSKKYSKQK